jgi:glycosyltransferase involved in cell wall biosynthesis
VKIPYVLDAHNPVFQDVGGKIAWGKLPLSQTLINNALAVIVHNHGILKLAKQAYPHVRFFNIPDPVERIASNANDRRDQQILVICSFDPDEPVDVLIETMRQLPEYTFVITADVMKLPANSRAVLQALPNIRLTGFLPIQDYHQILCCSLAALVLTNQDLIQPSGACEALSSDTPLLVSKTSLTSELFGEWAVLVENAPESIVPAVRSLKMQPLNLAQYRERWNQAVNLEIQNLQHLLDQSSQQVLTQGISRT